MKAIFENRVRACALRANGNIAFAARLAVDRCCLRRGSKLRCRIESITLAGAVDGGFSVGLDKSFEDLSEMAEYGC